MRYNYETFENAIETFFNSSFCFSFRYLSTRTLATKRKNLFCRLSFCFNFPKSKKISLSNVVAGQHHLFNYISNYRKSLYFNFTFIGVSHALTFMSRALELQKVFLEILQNVLRVAITIGTNSIFAISFYFDGVKIRNELPKK
jgi:hypothetical protein